MNVVVREARPEDDAAVGALLVAAFTDAYAKKMPDVVVTEGRRRDLLDVAGRRAHATILVAEAEGRVVGCVSLYRPGAEGSEAFVPGAADLRMLATAPALHGRGLAKPLMDAAEALAWAWGCRAVCLHVRHGVHGVARLYERRGYRRVREGDLSYPHVELEAYVLDRPAA